MAKIDKQEISIILWGTEIGKLTWDRINRNSFFFFSPAYFSAPYDISPIYCPKNSRTARLPIRGLNERGGEKEYQIYQSLPPFIADSLPDKWGNAIFDKWFEENGLKEEEKTPLTKLSFIGKRAIGALEFKPEKDAGIKEGERIDLENLYQEAQFMEDELRGRRIERESITQNALRALGTSPGGRQMKSIIDFDSEGNAYSGKIEGRENLKHCIIKFNTPQYCLSEIEMTYYRLAKFSGIDMMPCWIKEIDGTKHFVTERFDRQNGKKQFVQTLAAINPSARTYEDLFLTARKLGLEAKGQVELFRRAVFNFLLNNTDDHRKNFSFLMDESGKWHPTPAYDMNFIISESGIHAEKTHCMSLLGKLSDVTKEDLIEFGKRNGINHPEEIIRKVVQSAKEFQRIGTEEGINGFYLELIGNTIANLCGLEPPQRKQSEGSVSFEMTQNGNIHVHYEDEGKAKRFVVTPKRELYRFILENGFNSMSKGSKDFVIITIKNGL